MHAIARALNHGAVVESPGVTCIFMLILLSWERLRTRKESSPQVLSCEPSLWTEEGGSRRQLGPLGQGWLEDKI